ncbi:MAG: KR domain-containing protein [Xanthomonadaceae bacterium]|nr:KR domain-containing protein [Xanthomonadaceae bacterium]
MADDLQSKATDFVKKILSVGVGTIFLTEEAMRNMVTEFKLPKELINGIMQSANNTRKEFLQTLSHEVFENILSKVDSAKLIQEFFEKNEVDLQIRIKVSPKSKSE